MTSGIGYILALNSEAASKELRLTIIHRIGLHDEQGLRTKVQTMSCTLKATVYILSESPKYLVQVRGIVAFEF